MLLKNWVMFPCAEFENWIKVTISSIWCDSLRCLSVIESLSFAFNYNNPHLVQYFHSSHSCCVPAAHSSPSFCPSPSVEASHFSPLITGDFSSLSVELLRRVNQWAGYSLLRICLVECSSGRPPAWSHSQEVLLCTMALNPGYKLLRCEFLRRLGAVTWSLYLFWSIFIQR